MCGLGSRASPSRPRDQASSPGRANAASAFASRQVHWLLARVLRRVRAAVAAYAEDRVPGFVYAGIRIPAKRRVTAFAPVLTVPAARSARRRAWRQADRGPAVP